jgi:phenylacetate-CoA ligase
MTKAVPHRFHNRPVETLPRKDLDRLRLHLLRRTLRHAYEGSAHYKAAFKDARFDPAKVRSIDDISKIPLLTRFEVSFSQSSWPPFGDLLCVNGAQLSTTVMTSGNVGRPILVPLTENDSTYYCAPDSELWYRAIHPFGRKKDDIILSTWSHAVDAWSASSLALSRRRRGMPIVISGGATVEQELAILARLRPTILLTSPTVCSEMRKRVSELRTEERERIRVRAIIIGGALGRKDLVPWDLQGHDVEMLEVAYAAEVGLIGHECQVHDGLHVPEDHLLVEVLDRDGSPVAPGEEGELVVTTLRHEAMPLIRYRLGDITATIPGQCPCGRTHMRLKGLLGKVTPSMVQADVPGPNGPA